MKRVILGVALLLWARPLVAQQRSTPPGFDHPKHAKLFPSCVSCHAGATDTTRSFWPDPAGCASCHDGTIQKRVTWQPPSLRHSNLKFLHPAHTAALIKAGRSVLPDTNCVGCHTGVNAPPMAVQRAAVARCLDCHGVKAEHLAAPDTACATCHFALPQAVRLVNADVARFSAPPSHKEPGFAQDHGAAANAGTQACAVCHARDFCASCHVNAPEQRIIQSLASDPRSLAIHVKLKAPASHSAATFLSTHGATARRAPATCNTCHTRENCLTCHAANPRIAAAVTPGGAGRGPGAELLRKAPASHTPAFREGHGTVAGATPATCAGCHARGQCLDCHRPTAAAARGYHPAAFLARHPASAYARETSCQDCHNTQAFCASCHNRAGLSARVPLGAGYHDGKRAFIAGHGVAARQSLESCVSCHAERDCMSCHGSVGGRRFNPHGPGFNAALLRKKNPEMCTACHGSQIPGGS